MFFPIFIFRPNDLSTNEKSQEIYEKFFIYCTNITYWVVSSYNLLKKSSAENQNHRVQTAYAFFFQKPYNFLPYEIQTQISIFRKIGLLSFLLREPTSFFERNCTRGLNKTYQRTHFQSTLCDDRCLAKSRIFVFLEVHKRDQRTRSRITFLLCPKAKYRILIYLEVLKDIPGIIGSRSIFLCLRAQKIIIGEHFFVLQKCTFRTCTFAEELNTFLLKFFEIIEQRR